MIDINMDQVDYVTIWLNDQHFPDMHKIKLLSSKQIVRYGMLHYTYKGWPWDLRGAWCRFFFGDPTNNFLGKIDWRNYNMLVVLHK